MEDRPICFACDNVATHYYKSREEYKKIFPTVYIAACKDHILDDPPGGQISYERISFEDYLVYHVMVS